MLAALLCLDILYQYKCSNCSARYIGSWFRNFLINQHRTTRTNRLSTGGRARDRGRCEAFVPDTKHSSNKINKRLFLISCRSIELSRGRRRSPARADSTASVSRGEQTTENKRPRTNDPTGNKTDSKASPKTDPWTGGPTPGRKSPGTQGVQEAIISLVQRSLQ